MNQVYFNNEFRECLSATMITKENIIVVKRIFKEIRFYDDLDYD